MAGSKSLYVGVDGCPGGWFSVGFASDGDFETKPFRKFVDLVSYYENAKLILVDIPIGLPNISECRGCDRKAKKWLGGKRAGSVFSPPCRDAVDIVMDLPEEIWFLEQRLRLKIVNGKLREKSQEPVTLQLLGIIPKIGEVNDFLNRRGEGHSSAIREIHPELCFWVLDGRKPMEYSKRNKQGIKERLRVLANVEQRAKLIYEEACGKYTRAGVARDDILDALVAALTAYLGHDNLQAVPKAPQIDAKKLSMEMVYWRT